LAFNGLRKVACGTQVDAGSGALTLADISTGIQNLDVFGRDKSELLLVVSLREENTLRQLLGINLAVNQLGLTGTALPGEIGRHSKLPNYFADLKTRKFGGTPEMDNTEPSLVIKLLGRCRDYTRVILENISKIEDIVRTAYKSLMMKLQSIAEMTMPQEFNMGLSLA